MELDLAGRLLIEKVVLKNFKSYAGEKVIGPFHKNLTSVVGPNGSGKSNLLESLLFAFGKRARKMRLKKLSELIHRSSAHPNLSEASVEVHFVNIIDHGDTCEEVPGSRLVLTRVVKKNSTSEYRLDGRSSSFEEITNMLKYRGIDLEHNRFLILQGEVEQIAMMKPKAAQGEESKSGLLEYLEEIIGTDKYVQEIELAEKELENLGDEVSSKKLRFEESKKAMDNLEAPMKEAVGYIELDKECYSFKNLNFRLECFKTQLKTVEVSDELSQQDNKLADLDLKYDQKVKDNKVAITEYESKAKEIRKIQDQVSKTENELKRIIDLDNDAHSELTKTQNSIKSIRDDISKNQNRCQGIEKDLEDLSQRVPQLETNLEQIKLIREEKEKNFKIIESQVFQITQDLTKRKNAAEESLKPIKREFTRLRAEKEAKLQELNNLKQDLTSGEAEKQQLVGKIEELNAQKSKIEVETVKLQENIGNYAKELENLQNAQENVLIDLEQKRRKQAEINSKIRQIENDDKKLFEARGQLSEILKAKMEKVLSGIHGRLGDLATIPPVYDVAASSAISRLDYVVVDTVNDGNKLLEFCRNRRLGKINIIVLEKINVDRSRLHNFSSPDTKAVRLFDQLTISDDKFKEAFYFAFQDTLFTDRIEDARRIAFGASRFRVVTKDGNILDPSGEMRGFAHQIKGKIKTSGSVSSSGIKGNITELRNELQQVQTQIDSLIKQKEKTDSESSKLRPAEREAKQSLIRLQNELKNIINNIQTSENRLQVLQKRSTENMQAEIERCEKIVNAVNENFEKTGRVIEQRSKEIESILIEIELAAGEEFRRLKIEFNSVVQEEEKIESELELARVKLEQRKKDKEKYAKAQETAEIKLNDLLRHKEEISVKRKEFAETSIKLAEEYKSLKADLDKNNDMMKDLEKQREKIAKEFQEIKIAKEEVKARKSELTSQFKQLETEIARWTTKVDHVQSEFTKLESEYSELLQNMEAESSQVQVSESTSKKSKYVEERLSLRRPVFWTPSDSDLLQLLPSHPVIVSIQKALEQELESSSPNLKVIDDYKAKKSDKLDKESILNDVKQREIDQRNRYIDIKNRRFNEFTRGFREISEKLRDMYNLLTRGGNAELEFADSTDPFSEGIVFTVRPPAKSWKKMANLSGGEKTLSSLALVFALHHYKPNALYVMDEVDAALDFQNVSVIANYIKGETKNAQFIVVSLRYQMFEVADQLVGIYKVRDVSQSLCISPNSLAQEEGDNVIIKQTLENIAIKSN